MLLLATACGADGPSLLGPQVAVADLAPFLTSEHVDGVPVTLAVTAPSVQTGDTVRLVVTVRNATPRLLQIGVQCGPALDVLIGTPEGRVRSALADVTNGGYFTCELGSQHFLAADSVRVASMAWVAPATRGVYTAVAGLRRSAGLGNPSAAVRFTVR